MGKRPPPYRAIAAMTCGSAGSVKLSIALSGGPKYHQPIVASNAPAGPRRPRRFGSRGRILIIFSKTHQRLALISSTDSHGSQAARPGSDRHLTHSPVGPAASAGPRATVAHR